MSVTFLVYPFIVTAIYFEVFLLLTFLSEPARSRRKRPATTSHTPDVAMIVPCFNEGKTIEGTVASLLALDYPTEHLSIVLVDDGSTDNTAEVMDRYHGHPQITVIHQPNRGKHEALNAGIAATQAELIGCLDADSFVERSALREIIPCFTDTRVGAATSAMSVHEPKNILERMQNAEYILGIALRHVLSAVNGIYVTPGPFSLYRRDIVMQLGGFRHGHQTEDMEMALRIQRAGYEIDNAPRARVFTKVPRTVFRLVKQRTRWTSGFLRNVLGEYRDLVGNPKYGTLGLLVLPLGFLAIAGTALLFCIAVFEFVRSLVSAYFITHGVPLSYTLTPHYTTEWLYIPATLMTLLVVIASVGSVLFIIIGRRVSDTPGKLGISVLAYMLVYGLVAPFWLFRAIADIVTGTRSSWR